MATADAESLIERDEDARAHVRPFILTPSSGAADAQEKGQYAGPVNRVLRGQCPRNAQSAGGDSLSQPKYRAA